MGFQYTVDEEREMDGYNDNNPTMMKPGGFQEGIPMESRKLTEEMGNKRQALRHIKNFVGAPPPYPLAINKRRLPEKFATSLAERQLSHQDISKRSDKMKNEKTERAIPSIPSSNNLENITIIDVEEYMDPASAGVFLMEDISKLWGAQISVEDWINPNKQL